MIKVGNQFHRAEMISKVSPPFASPFEFVPLLINAGLALAGVVVIISGLGSLLNSVGAALGSILIGGAMTALGVFNVKGCIKKQSEWNVVVQFIHQEESLLLVVDSKQKAEALSKSIVAAATA